MLRQITLVTCYTAGLSGRTTKQGAKLRLERAKCEVKAAKCEVKAAMSKVKAAMSKIKAAGITRSKVKAVRTLRSKGKAASMRASWHKGPPIMQKGSHCFLTSSMKNQVRGHY